jgi:hypothetical protein
MGDGKCLPEFLLFELSPIIAGGVAYVVQHRSHKCKAVQGAEFKV